MRHNVQVDTSKSQRRAATLSRLSVLVALAWGPSALAQTPEPTPGREAWTYQPSVTLQQTFTDNVLLTTPRKSDSVTELSGNIRARGRSSNITGFVDYSLTGVAYAKTSEFNDVRHALDAAATAELVAGLAYLDMEAGVGQQVASAFGTLSTEPSRQINNRDEVTRLALVPTLRGRLGENMAYDASLRHEMVRVRGKSASGADNTVASFRLDGGSPRLGWGASLIHRVSDQTRRIEETWAYVTVRGEPHPEFRVAASVGHETGNLTTGDQQGRSTVGARLTWIPSPRTTLDAQADRRAFGRTHGLTFSHRTVQTMWLFSDTRETSSGVSVGSTRIASTYELLYQQLVGVEPDPVKRDTLTRDILAKNGLNPNSTVVSGFLSGAAVLQRTVALSFGWLGPRNALTMRVAQTRTERASSIDVVADDLQLSSRVRQQGVTIDASHQFTPITSITASGYYQKTTGVQDALTSELKSVLLGGSWRMTPRSVLAVSARQATFNSSTNPYRERAATATYRLQF